MFCDPYTDCLGAKLLEEGARDGRYREARADDRFIAEGGIDSPGRLFVVGSRGARIAVQPLEFTTKLVQSRARGCWILPPL